MSNVRRLQCGMIQQYNIEDSTEPSLTVDTRGNGFVEMAIEGVMGLVDEVDLTLDDVQRLVEQLSTWMRGQRLF